MAKNRKDKPRLCSSSTRSGRVFSSLSAPDSATVMPVISGPMPQLDVAPGTIGSTLTLSDLQKISPAPVSFSCDSTLNATGCAPLSGLLLDTVPVSKVPSSQLSAVIPCPRTVCDNAYANTVRISTPDLVDCPSTDNVLLSSSCGLVSSPVLSFVPLSSSPSTFKSTAMQCPPAVRDIATASADSKSWKSLFCSLPRSAGDYVPCDFEFTPCRSPPTDVLNAGISRWKDFPVGFFLDSKASYYEVRDHCRRRWQLSGGLRVIYIDDLFFFKFSNVEERRRVLEMDPIIINGRPFIVTAWSPTMDRGRERVQSIPFWAHMTHIPTVLQTLLGLNWLASRIGKLRCFDASTVGMDSYVFARALIEITPDGLPPSQIHVCIDGLECVVNVKYDWTSDICLTCKSFFHTSETCKCVDGSPFPPKITLFGPPPRQWVPKSLPFDPAEAQKLDIDTDPSHSEAHLDSPLYVDDAPLPVDPTVIDVVPVPPVEPVNLVLWDSTDQTCLHDPTGMRYSPKLQVYYIYVREVGSGWRLLYQDINGDITLFGSGDFGKRNAYVMKDLAWDRNLLYGPDSPGYDASLGTFFSKILHVNGPESSDDGNGSSSSDKD